VASTPLRNGAAIRRERLQMIVAIVKNEPSIRIARIQILMAMRTGLTEKRVAQYVRELVEGEFLVEEGGRFRVAERR